jgi:hypothetical protein
MVDTLARMQQSLEAAGVVFCFCSNWVRFAKTGPFWWQFLDAQLMVVDNHNRLRIPDGLILFVELNGMRGPYVCVR